MYRHNSVLDFNTRKTLCNSLIQCLFDYACSAWYNNLGKTLKSKLQITQNKVVRFILNVPPRTTLTCSDFHKLGMLKLNDRVKQLSLNHVHIFCMTNVLCTRKKTLLRNQMSIATAQERASVISMFLT